MNASTIIGCLSALVVGAACSYASEVGAPPWLDGNEAEVAVKAATVLTLAMIAVRLWRAK